MSIQQTVQKALDTATADLSQPNAVPGAVMYIADKSGKQVAWASSGVRQAGKSEPMTKDSVFWIASCTKLITAIACLQLVEQSKISLQDPVTKYVPEMEKVTMVDGSKPKNVATIWNCLTHTCGLGYSFFNRTLKDLEAEQGRKVIDSFDASKHSIMGPYVTEPGSEWEYGVGIDWAGQVVEKVSGKSLNDYFHEAIFKPLGIKHASFLPHKAGLSDKLVGSHHRNKQGIISPNSHWMQHDESKIDVQYGGAGLWANAAEYCQILVALLNGGTHPKSGGKILNPESVDELVKGQLTGKLQEDMDREFPNTDPDISNYFEGCTVKGVPKTWALGGLRLQVEHPMFKRSDKSLFWCGIQNSFWWCDFKDGTCGMIQSQIGPFLDMGTLGILAQIEPQVHAAYASA
ncbi:related to transesterase [Melanopsichium pennsylvanicum]|uniref:Related to transesterase n=2 Tax=Melanopsichium pennsylvanicum TaxID=63383 RepID=A0AAJ4XQ62_9BASI|nr:related to transesterase [Melanopsichium pennsylvanicum 4]SNX85886.1 related to transesterase [Melanopsichium pennsylvanicum]